MKLIVTIYGVNADDFDKTDLIGTVVWDGERMTTTGDDRRMKPVLREPVFVPGPRGIRDLHAAEDPVLFMRTLCKHYKSPYFYATKAVQS